MDTTNLITIVIVIVVVGVAGYMMWQRGWFKRKTPAEKIEDKQINDIDQKKQEAKNAIDDAAEMAKKEVDKNAASDKKNVKNSDSPEQYRQYRGVY